MTQKIKLEERENQYDQARLAYKAAKFEMEIAGNLILSSMTRENNWGNSDLRDNYLAKESYFTQKEEEFEGIKQHMGTLYGGLQ